MTIWVLCHVITVNQELQSRTLPPTGQFERSSPQPTYQLSQYIQYAFVILVVTQVSINVAIFLKAFF